MKWKPGIVLALMIGACVGRAQTGSPPPSQVSKAVVAEVPKAPVAEAVKPDAVAKPDAPKADFPKADAPKADAQKVAADPAKPAVRPYVVGPLDVLDIRVWNDQKMSQVYEVRSDGMISMPLIGELRADGLTVPELTKLIRDKIATSVTNEPPDVNIQPIRVNSQKIYIHGAVFRQGEMPIVGEMKILDAIANCGGFKDFAKTTKIYVLRGEKRFYFNYKDVIKGKHMEQNIVLENGDHLFIPGD